jgi:hypothetical protein
MAMCYFSDEYLETCINFNSLTKKTRCGYEFLAGKITRKEFKEYEKFILERLPSCRLKILRLSCQISHNEPKEIIECLEQTIQEAKIDNTNNFLSKSIIAFRYSLISENERKKHIKKRNYIHKEEYHYIKPSCCSETDCMICMEELKSGVKTECGKVFHKECIEKWKQINNTCPNCRKKEPETTKFKFIYNVKDGFCEIRRDDFSVKELKQLCKENDIKGYTKLKKQELLNLFGL